MSTRRLLKLTLVGLLAVGWEPAAIGQTARPSLYCWDCEVTSGNNTNFAREDVGGLGLGRLPNTQLLPAERQDQHRESLATLTSS